MSAAEQQFTIALALARSVGRSSANYTRTHRARAPRKDFVMYNGPVKVCAEHSLDKERPLEGERARGVPSPCAGAAVSLNLPTNPRCPVFPLGMLAQRLRGMCPIVRCKSLGREKNLSKGVRCDINNKRIVSVGKAENLREYFFLSDNMEFVYLSFSIKIVKE